MELNVILVIMVFPREVMKTGRSATIDRRKRICQGFAGPGSGLRPLLVASKLIQLISTLVRNLDARISFFSITKHSLPHEAIAIWGSCLI